ncbi:hypothetical protein LEMLEM_LOCUS21541 [Lemmus lemmus]
MGNVRLTLQMEFWLVGRMLAAVRICRASDCETRSTPLYMKSMSFCTDCTDTTDGISMSL